MQGPSGERQGSTGSTMRSSGSGEEGLARSRLSLSLLSGDSSSSPIAMNSPACSTLVDTVGAVLTLARETEALTTGLEGALTTGGLRHTQGLAPQQAHRLGPQATRTFVPMLSPGTLSPCDLISPLPSTWKTPTVGATTLFPRRIGLGSGTLMNCGCRPVLKSSCSLFSGRREIMGRDSGLRVPG